MTPSVYMALSKVRLFLRRHHPVIFISVLGIVLALALLMLYGVLSATDISVTPNNTISTFDTDTENKIKNLRASDSTGSGATITLPSNRTNPFVE